MARHAARGVQARGVHDLPEDGVEPGPLIDMRGIDKAFGGVKVLSDVSLQVQRGEVVALLGANGAGKSTLVKILTGNYIRDAGDILLDGSAVDLRAPADAIGRGVRMLPQELSVFADMTVAENILLGSLPTRKAFGVRTVDKAVLVRQAGELLARMGLSEIDPGARMASLSHHAQRVVEIARALAGNARVLVMDEPTAALTEAEVQKLFAIVRRLQADGVAVVYISHYLDEVFQVSDRIVVLRDGKNAGSFVTAEASEEAVLEAIVGNRMGNIFPGFAAAPGGEDFFTVAGLEVQSWLTGVDLAIKRGEITGVYGLIGSGVEVVGRALFGVVPHTRIASARLDGAPYVIRDPRHAVASGLGLVAAERKREGIIGMLSLRENLSVSNLAQFKSGLMVDRHEESRVVGDWIRRLTIQARDAEQHVGTLSGGNQQKVCLARWLIGDAKVLILEEPTRGVDVGARQEIYRQMRELADKGLAVLLVSTDAEEVAGLADRSLVLAGGGVAATFDTPTEATALMSAASHLAAA